MMSNKIRPLIAVATLVLFTLSCGLKPTELSTENNDAGEGNHTEIDHESSIKIAELVNNTDKYVGKTVQLTGTCTKINTGIMGHNWIHLIDGSMDDYDLVITSDAIVAKGNDVTMTGVVAINKDFGAGYSYELILEEGKVIE